MSGHIVKLVLVLKSAVAPDVPHPVAVSSKDATDQEATMATGRVLFAADDRGGSSLERSFEHIDASEEVGTLGQLPVEDPTLLIVEALVGGPSPKLLAQEEVPDPVCLEGSLEGGAVEVARVGRVGVRANVDRNGDVVRLEQSDEPIEGVIRVSDGEDGPVLRGLPCPLGAACIG